MSEKNGGPAFPHPNIQGTPGTIFSGHKGMSLRDYFAAAVLPEIRRVSADSTEKELNDLVVALGIGPCKGPELAAYLCYAQADAMLAARKKGESDE